ncbi:MAG: diguanylate cyclase [Dehalococcoidia bacterium]|nr:diguanylate cyclase [Dehalococcoidia bacterium]
MAAPLADWHDGPGRARSTGNAPADSETDYVLSQQPAIDLLRLYYLRTPEQILDVLAEMTGQALPGARVLPFLFDRWTLTLDGAVAGKMLSPGTASLIAQLHLDPESLALPVPVGGLLEAILEEGEVVVAEPEDLLEGSDVGALGGGGAVAMPLEVDGEALGLVAVFVPTTPRPEDCTRLELIAAHGAIAVRNQRDLDEAQRLHAVDAITFAANRRAITNKLDDEIERAKRYSHNLSVLLVEVMGVRDTTLAAQHNAANRLLRRMAMLLAGSLRAPDMVGRYEESHFLIVLPETDSAGGATVARRLGSQMARLKSEGVADISARIAAATLPHDTWDMAELMEILALRIESSPVDWTEDPSP